MRLPYLPPIGTALGTLLALLLLPIGLRAAPALDPPLSPSWTLSLPSNQQVVDLASSAQYGPLALIRLRDSDPDGFGSSLLVSYRDAQPQILREFRNDFHPMKLADLGSGKLAIAGTTPTDSTTLAPRNQIRVYADGVLSSYAADGLDLDNTQPLFTGCPGRGVLYGQSTGLRLLDPSTELDRPIMREIRGWDLVSVTCSVSDAWILARERSPAAHDQPRFRIYRLSLMDGAVELEHQTRAQNTRIYRGIDTHFPLYGVYALLDSSFLVRHPGGTWATQYARWMTRIRGSLSVNHDGPTVLVPDPQRPYADHAYRRDDTWRRSNVQDPYGPAADSEYLIVGGRGTDNSALFTIAQHIDSNRQRIYTVRRYDSAR